MTDVNLMNFVLSPLNRHAVGERAIVIDVNVCRSGRRMAEHRSGGLFIELLIDVVAGVVPKLVRKYFCRASLFGRSLHGLAIGIVSVFFTGLSFWV